jgi:D-alanyl-D-alanine dipeptidase
MKNLKIISVLMFVGFATFFSCVNRNAPVQETETIYQVEIIHQKKKIKTPLPEGFVYLTDVLPDVILDIRYYGTYNFLGVRVDGYEAPVAILTTEAAEALKKANEIIKAQGYVFRVFDAFRPQRSVDHFVRWARDINDTKMQAIFYPDVNKSVLFSEGYISSRSGHSRGSTIDLTLVDIRTGKELDMGSMFDWFGERSAHGAAGLTSEQQQNREILRQAMTSSGFRIYEQEWWHYTLRNEPFPDMFFDFPVK